MGRKGDIENLRDKLKRNRAEPARARATHHAKKETPKRARRYVLLSHGMPLSFGQAVVTEKPHRFQKIIDIRNFSGSVATEGTETHVAESDNSRSKMILKVFVYLVFLTIIGLLFYVITPLSTLTTVSISGVTQLSNQDVYELSGVETGDKMYFIATNEVANTLTNSPLIEDAVVTKEGFNTLNIHIVEQHTVAYLPDANLFHPVQSNGYLVLEPVTVPTYGPLIYHFDEETMPAVVGALAELDFDTVGSISEIYARPNAENSERIQLFMNDGQQVIADISSLSDKFSYYASIRSEIVDSTEGLIDLEVSNSFLPYSSQEARELMASIYGESISQQERDALEAILAPLRTELENFSVQ